MCYLTKGVGGGGGGEISIIRGNFVICVFTVGRFGYDNEYGGVAGST
jgi:hypothetical protein